MSSSPAPHVLIFGPTGNVGSHAAQTASSHGAHVTLAMRDPSKPLDPSLQDTASFPRVRADLTDPSSLTSAAQSCHATRAFIYNAIATGDGMLASLQALKKGGVEFVVFLSSFTIGSAPLWGDAEKSAGDRKELIAWAHAKVEVSLKEVFGEKGYVALRAGGFATNMLRYKKEIMGGEEVRLFGGSFGMDCITPEDMGAVAGRILAEQDAVKDGQREVYLFGPQILSMRDAVQQAGKVLGKEVKVVEIGEEEAREQMKGQGMPPPFVDYMIRKLGEEASGKGQGEEERRPNYREGVENVKRYTGREGLGWEEWVGRNRGRFEA